MKVLIKLDSEFYTDEQNDDLYSNMIELEWNLPFIPRVGENFDCYSIIENMPEYDDGLCWSIGLIDYKKVNGEIVPILWLNGE